MSEEGFDALARDHTSEPGAGIDDVLAELDTEQRPRDETGKFVKKDDGAEGEEPAGDTEESEPAKAEAEVDDDAAPDDQTSGEEAEDDEPTDDESGTIEAPAFWADEEKEVFAKLQPEAQEIILRRESERNTATSARLAETAAQRKAADAEREAAQTERQNLAQFLTQVSAYARTMDPIIAKGMNTDWAARTREVGADEAYAEQQEFAQRLQHLQAVEAELGRIQTESVRQRKDSEEKALAEKQPDLADAAKRQSFRDSSLPILAKFGYSPQEIDQYWEHMPDHRQALVLNRLVELERREAARQSLRDKKAKTPPPKVQKPKAQQDAKAEETARVAALRKHVEKDPNDIDALTEFAQRSIGAR